MSHEEGEPWLGRLRPPGALARYLQTNRKVMKRYFFVFTIYVLATGATFGAGSAALKTEGGDRSAQAYNQGIQLMHAKKFAEAHNNLGYSLRKQGPQNYSKALEHYNRAIQLKPNLAEAYEYRGVLFLKMGRIADSEKDVATLKTLIRSWRWSWSRRFRQAMKNEL